MLKSREKRSGGGRANTWAGDLKSGEQFDMPSSLLWVYIPQRLFVPFPVPTKARKFGPGVVRAHTLGAE